MSTKIKMVFEPGKEVSREDFRKYPRGSVAIDGYCKDGPFFDEDRGVLNINHHDVFGLAMRTSCLQAMIYVKMGLLDAFTDENGDLNMTLYMNDPDQDVALSTYILMHPEQVNRPKLRELVRIEDLMDMSGGLYPTRKRLHLMKQLNWIMRPYTKARVNGRLYELDGKGMEALVREMHRRIKLTLFNGPTEVDVDTSYEVLADHGSWQMVREIGEDARIGMAENQVKAYVTFKNETDGRYHYAIGRLSQFIPFPLQKLYDDLNEAEGLGPDAKHRWGGSGVIGGSPRGVGSKLSPEEVAAVINRRLAKRRKTAASK